MRFWVELILTILSDSLEAILVQIYNFFRRFVVEILFATYIRLDYNTGKLKFINHLIFNISIKNEEQPDNPSAIYKITTG